MSLDSTFWMVAWGFMALTFVTATSAILLGAKGLDREYEKSQSDSRH